MFSHGSKCQLNEFSIVSPRCTCSASFPMAFKAVPYVMIYNYIACYLSHSYGSKCLLNKLSIVSPRCTCSVSQPVVFKAVPYAMIWSYSALLCLIFLIHGCQKDEAMLIHTTFRNLQSGKFCLFVFVLIFVCLCVRYHPQFLNSQFSWSMLWDVMWAIYSYRQHIKQGKNYSFIFEEHIQKCK